MSLKAVGLYGGFFVGMFAVALFVTGTLQHAVLPRLLGHGTKTAGEPEQSKPAETTPAPRPEKTGNEAPPTPTPPQPEAARSTLGKPPAATPGEPGAQVKRLARMYEGMRPKEAAAVLEKLDRPMAALVLAEIRERQAAKILGAMNPSAAAELTRMVGQAPEKPS